MKSMVGACFKHAPTIDLLWIIESKKYIDTTKSITHYFFLALPALVSITGDLVLDDRG
jgi:hypothetical protein